MDTKDLTPKFAGFQGGDQSDPEYWTAATFGLKLALDAGFYYAVAEINWLNPNTCVRAEFNPPGRTLKLVPGGLMKVETQVKTKAGQRVKSHYPVVHADIGSVEPMETYSDVGQPMKATYTAPEHYAPSPNGPKPGFAVSATSLAGVAEATWEAGLGKNWSGQIIYELATTGDQGSNDLQTWANSEVARVTIDVKDGVGKAYGHYELKTMSKTRQRVAQGGYIDESSQSVERRRIGGFV